MVLVCFTPTRAGTHPDLRAPGFAWPPGDLAKALKLHSDDPLYFFSKGALPVDLLRNDRCEYDYAEAHKFAKQSTVCPGGAMDSAWMSKRIHPGSTPGRGITFM